MSGYVSSNYIPIAVRPEEESAGKAVQYLGVIASVIMPFAAPAVFGAIASSGVLGSGLAAAASAGTMGTLTSVLGSAAVGALTNAGIAYAGGARGAEVWGAAGAGALSAGAGGLSRALTPAAAATGAAGAPAVGAANVGAAVPGVGAGAVSGASSVVGNLVGGAGTAPTTVTGTLMNGVRQILGNVSGQSMNRIGAAIINAAVNGQSMGRLDGLVAQQRAELEALRNSDRAVYEQRINAAQQILADADRMDPHWRAQLAMADVAGMEARQADQAMRNIAVRQGGSLDSGQAKAYERNSALHQARSKALAYNRAYVDAEGVQNQLRGQGAALMGPDTAGFANWQADTDLRAAQERARREASQSTWGGIAAGLFEQDHKPATSPDPSANQDDDNQNGFIAGLRWPSGFGGSN